MKQEKKSRKMRRRAFQFLLFLRYNSRPMHSIRAFRGLLTFRAVFCCGIGSATASVQDVIEAHTAALIGYYEELEASPENTFILRTIERRLETARNEAEKEVTAQIEAIIPGTDPSKADAGSGVSREQRILAVLRDLKNEQRVDLALLAAEEKLYGSSGKVIVPPNRPRTTQNHAELLARKALLQEVTGVLDGRISLHEARLGRMRSQLRLEQFSVLFTFGRYLLVALLAWLTLRLVRGMILYIPQLEHRYRANKALSGIVFILIFFWIVIDVISRNPGVMTSLAIVGAGIAIALQDVVKDIIGWGMIAQNRLFSRGERVTIGQDITGEIIDIGMLRTRMLEVKSEGTVQERTGKIISVPNAVVLSQQVSNHHSTSDYIRAEMRIIITFESNWRKAHTLLLDILRSITEPYDEADMLQHQERTRMYYIPRNSRGPAVHMDIVADGVEFTLRFSVPIGERRPIVTAITQKMLDAFEKEGNIDFAYKTIRSLSGSYAPSPSKLPEMQ